MEIVIIVIITIIFISLVGLVNDTIGTVRDILFENGQDPPLLPIAVFVEFDDYTGPAIMSAEGKKVVPIPPIRRTWETNTGLCSRLQIPVSLSWAVTVLKSQGLTLSKAVIDIGKKEYVSGLSFVVVSRVHALENILLKPFSFERL